MPEVESLRPPPGTNLEVVHEAASGRLFLGGRIHYPSLRKLFLRLHRHGNLWVGL